ncbi:MAG TPA: monofunctional biosynthetic peptidoglycan transglycosylase [Stellaceae bacterium]|nr:monofunctional biosynthetic peptidoglycan transglycosylase [Stellaceae bacterium]
MPPSSRSAPAADHSSRQRFGRKAVRRRPRGPRLLRWALYAVLIGLLLPVPFVIVYRFVPPPITTLQVIRWIGGAALDKHWEPLDRISAALPRAVIASEDEKFCTHHGFDWVAMNNAYRAWRASREPKGASTITMQVAKNLFLWPGRSVIRKAFEAYLTVLLEFFWDKHRIMEVYLNVIEWGDGIYGADAAAHHYFNKPAAALTAQEAALLAAVLPNPRDWSPVHPTQYIGERADAIRADMPAMQVPAANGCR